MLGYYFGQVSGCRVCLDNTELFRQDSVRLANFFSFSSVYPVDREEREEGSSMPDVATHCLEASATGNSWWKEDTRVVDEPIRKEDRLLEQLVERVRAHDPHAFENLIAHTQKRAFGLAYHLIGDYHKAQDILQEAYLRLYRHIGSLKNPRAFHSWFAQVITNLSKDCFRDKKQCEIPIEFHEPSLQEGPELIDGTIAREQVREILGRLTAIERTTLLLREYYELSYEEVASVLKIPIGTVRSRLAEARRKLADTMMKGGK
jgi:RNA polymerase sigma-70 factor, ECF subfamily